MPPIFMQPGDGGGGGGSYGQLASALQSRYAAESATQARSQLGFAELDLRRLAEQRDYELGVARLQLQPILQEQQARQQMDSWVMQRQFNQRDQAELNRQNAVMSELLEKREKGEISDQEFYRETSARAPLVNVLQAKQEHTKNAALNEQRKQMAEQHAEQGKLIAQRTDLFKKTVEDRVSFIMDPTVHDQLGREVDILEPELRMNPAGREEAIRFRAEQQGLGQHFFQEDIGRWKPLDKGLAAARQSTTTSAGGTEKPPPGSMTDAQYARLRESTAKSIKHDAKEAEQPVPSGEELENKVQEELKRNGFPATLAEHQATRRPTEQKAQQAQTIAEGATNAIDAKIQEAQARTDVPIEQRSKQITLLAMAKQMVSVFGPYKSMKPDAKKKYEQIVRDLNATALPAQPEQERIVVVPAPPQPGFGKRAMDWAGGVISDLRPAPIAIGGQ